LGPDGAPPTKASPITPSAAPAAFEKQARPLKARNEIARTSRCGRFHVLKRAATSDRAAELLDAIETGLDGLEIGRVAEAHGFVVAEGGGDGSRSNRTFIAG
jgi:hypothetical protein